MAKEKKPVRSPPPAAEDAIIPPHPDPTHRLPPEQSHKNGIAQKNTLQ